MQIKYIDGLLQTSITIRYKEHNLTIDHLVIDTGAGHTLLSSDIVAQIGIHYENGDRLVCSFSIVIKYKFLQTIEKERLAAPLYYFLQILSASHSQQFSTATGPYPDEPLVHSSIPEKNKQPLFHICPVPTDRCPSNTLFPSGIPEVHGNKITYAHGQ